MKKIYLSTILLACGVILAACSKQESSAPPASPAPTAAPAAPPAVAAAPASAEAPAAAATVAAGGDNALGQSTFKKVCFMCHATGLNGAPKVGDKAAWGPRIAQGKDVLYKHVLEGFTGTQGTMPPRGGSTLSDAEIKAGVDYIVSQAQQ
ncbi:MAG: c-type cytochrome [Burkholderiaceae bacterium]|jgi:cytochrome c5|nr:c-type cytochrome [Burkholderiaceae bacterium]